MSQELAESARNDPSTAAHISTLIASLAALRGVERSICDAYSKYLNLTGHDLRAVSYLVQAKSRGIVATPSSIATHLNVSAASTTKLLNRLESGGHIERKVHPIDRRALAIEIMPETEAAARRSITGQHSQRFQAAARLTHEERDVVIRFLNDMTEDLSLDSSEWA